MIFRGKLTFTECSRSIVHFQYLLHIKMLACSNIRILTTSCSTWRMTTLVVLKPKLFREVVLIIPLHSKHQNEEKMLSQRGAVLHWKFLYKVALAGCNSFSILEIIRNSKKPPFTEHLPWKVISDRSKLSSFVIVTVIEVNTVQEDYIWLQEFKIWFCKGRSLVKT